LQLIWAQLQWLWVEAPRPGAINLGTACHLLRSELPMIAVRYSYDAGSSANQRLINQIR
jgi:hypothetical protein